MCIVEKVPKATKPSRIRFIKSTKAKLTTRASQSDVETTTPPPSATSHLDTPVLVRTATQLQLKPFAGDLTDPNNSSWALFSDHLPGEDESTGVQYVALQRNSLVMQAKATFSTVPADMTKQYAILWTLKFDTASALSDLYFSACGAATRCDFSHGSLINNALVLRRKIQRKLRRYEWVTIYAGLVTSSVGGDIIATLSNSSSRTSSSQNSCQGYAIKSISAVEVSPQIAIELENGRKKKGNVGILDAYKVVC